MTEFTIVMTAFPGGQSPEALIQAVLEKKLAACVQTMDIGSHYTWKNQVCHEKETLLLFKTRKSLVQELETQITMMHPYEVPEILAVDAEYASKSYAGWLRAETKEPGPAIAGENPQQTGKVAMSSTEELLKKLGIGI